MDYHECEKEGCDKLRHPYGYRRQHRYCADHRCVRCMTRCRTNDSDRCEDCGLLCREAGNMCSVGRAPGSMYCVPHTCGAEGCGESKYDYRAFCTTHRCKTYRCLDQRSDSGSEFCDRCLERCVERGCNNLRPLGHPGLYYCDHHGCAECHAAPRHEYRERRVAKRSVYCEHHHEKNAQSDHVAYEAYKARKMVEAAAVLESGGDLTGHPTALHERALTGQLPRVVFHRGSCSTVVEEVLRSLLSGGLSDDVFAVWREHIPVPRRLLFSPATEAGIASVIEALAPIADEMNRCIDSVDVNNPVEYQQFVRRYFGAWTPYRRERLPRVCLETLYQRRRVLCKGELMYQVSSVIRVQDVKGDHFYGIPTRDYAWTIPVLDVDAFATEGGGRLEGMVQLDLVYESC